MKSLKDKVQQQFLKEVPDSIYNMDNFEKLTRAVNNMDHDLMNMGNDIDEYFKKYPGFLARASGMTNKTSFSLGLHNLWVNFERK